MSATGRPNVREKDDYYRTPKWCVQAILKHLPLLDGKRVLDPGCGDGGIMHSLPASAEVVGVEIDAERASKAMCDIPSNHIVFCDDFFAWSTLAPKPSGTRFDLAIGNPPYGLALEFVQQSMLTCDVTVMLMRINWLASQRRAEWMRKNTPSVYVLPKRPSFTNGGTDATDYAWMVWDGRPSRVVILDVAEAAPTRHEKTTKAASSADPVAPQSPRARATARTKPR